MPETGIHLELRTALYLTVRHFVGQRGAVGSEQFVYWDPGGDAQGERLVLSPEEAALARVAELEAELSRRG